MIVGIKEITICQKDEAEAVLVLVDDDNLSEANGRIKSVRLPIQQI